MLWAFSTEKEMPITGRADSTLVKSIASMITLVARLEFSPHTLETKIRRKWFLIIAIWQIFWQFLAKHEISMIVFTNGAFG